MVPMFGPSMQLNGWTAMVMASAIMTLKMQPIPIISDSIQPLRTILTAMVSQIIGLHFTTAPMGWDSN